MSDKHRRFPVMQGKATCRRAAGVPIATRVHPDIRCKLELIAQNYSTDISSVQRMLLDYVLLEHERMNDFMTYLEQN